jgi:DNA polymerase type B, organellar and viral
MGTKYHVLRPLRGSSSPRSIIFFDVECWSDPISNRVDCRALRFRLGHAITVYYDRGRETYRDSLTFCDPAKLWDYVDSKIRTRRTNYLCGFNLGVALTTTEFWGSLSSQRYKLVRGCFEDPPTIITVTNHGRPLTIFDMLNYWNVPLDVLGDQVGLPRLATIPQTALTSDLVGHCIRDCEIMVRAMSSLIGVLYERGWGNITGTAASQAFSAYRHSFLSAKINIPASIEGTRIERGAYFSGRVDCNHVGPVNERVYVLDHNSLYPSVMRQHRYPCRLERVIERPSIREAKSWLQSYGVIAHVGIRSDYAEYPIRTTRGVRWARGDYDTYIAGPELHRAINRLDVRRIYSVAVYDLADIFSRYVDCLYGERLQARRGGRLADEALYKLLLNSLYGKFGQRANTWTEASNIAAPCEYGEFLVRQPGGLRCIKCRAVARKVWRKSEGGEALHSFPAISAYVTMYGRERMREVISIAGRHEVWYQDSDCIHTSKYGLDALQREGELHPDQLGKLKESSYAGAYYRGPRDYRIGEVEKISGVTNPDASVITNSVYQQSQLSGLRSILRDTPGDFVAVKTTNLRFGRNHYSDHYVVGDSIAPLYVSQTQQGHVVYTPDHLCTAGEDRVVALYASDMPLYRQAGSDAYGGGGGVGSPDVLSEVSNSGIPR